jgi:membrane fusion protein (multidrug efflux system)
MDKTMADATFRETDGLNSGASIGEAALRRSAPVAGPTVAPQTETIAKPSSRRRTVLLVALAGALCLGGYWGYHWYTEGRFIVSTDDAYVRADMSTIAAKASGLVTSVAVVDNQHVKAGDLLVQIDDGDYLLARDAARQKIETQAATVDRIGAQVLAQDAMVLQARAQQAAAVADGVRATSEYARVTRLVQSSFGTAQRMEQAQADLDRTKANSAQADAAVAAAIANRSVLVAQRDEAVRLKAELQTTLDKAVRDLSFTQVRAPFDGVVGNRAAQPGQYVQAGTRLLALVPLDSVYVEANFKETQIDRLRAGQPATIAVDAFGSRTITGTVESFAPASGAQFSLLPPENATGNFTKVVQRLPIRIKVPVEVAREGLLRPGLSVIVDVRTKARP